MAEKSKWLKIGQIVENDGKNGKYEMMQLDNENLKEFFGFLKKFGQEQIGDKSVEDIRKAQKLKRDDPNHLPRVQIYRFEKKDEDYDKGCPEFILADLMVKMD